MKIPQIIRSEKILNRLSWLMRIKAIALWPWVILREKIRWDDARTINHESIHIKQQQELLILPFYIWYLLEYIFRIFQYRNTFEAYKNISFEREAYANESNYSYLRERKLYSFLKYLSI